MKIIDLLKEGTYDKYLNMLEGKTANVTDDIGICSADKFLSNYENTITRLEKETEEINKRLSFIQKNDRKRKKEEQKKADEEKLNAEYQRAVSFYNAKQYNEAIRAFEPIKDYKDSYILALKCKEEISRQRLEREEAQRRANEEALQASIAASKRKARNKALAAVLLIAIAVGGLVGGIFIRNSGYSAKNINMSVVSKNNTQYQNNYCSFDLIIKVNNQTAHSISSIKGTMTIKDINDTVLASGNTSIETGHLSPNSNANSTLTINVNGNNAEKIWAAGLSQLTITFDISGINFDGSYKNASREIVLSKATNSIDVSNNNGQDGYYEDAAWENDMLRALAQMAGKEAILPDDWEMYSYSSNETIEHNESYYQCFYADMHVPDNQTDSYMNAFRNKLLKHGYSELNSNCYRKNSTIVYFTDPEWYYDSYGFGYYAFIE